MPGPDLSEQPVSSTSTRSWNSRRLPVVPRWLGLIALVVVLLGASAWVIGQQLSSSPSRRRTTPAYVTFKDPAGLFQGGYPSSWKRIQTGNPQVVLLAQGPGGASYEVTKTTLTAAINATNLGTAEKLTNRIVLGGPKVKLVTLHYRQPAPLSIGGLPGLLYIYTFVDPTSGQTGAHAQYFVFDGKTMITLVFQSLPSTNFETLAPLFDRVSRTFRLIRH